MRLEGKNILLAVGGGIAAYKIPSLIRLLQKEGATVKVFISPSAKYFITPFLLRALSGNDVEEEFFSNNDPFLHINATKKADLFLVAPATAQMIAQFAHGFASDLISATVLASSCPILVVPSMNSRMWKNPLLQRNIEILKESNFLVIDPGSGDLACGEMGEGRLPELEIILHEAKKALTFQDLKAKKVILTAGPTRESLDPVRFISNRSSGLMGLCLALEAFYRGAEVTLITSCDYRPLPQKIHIIKVESASQMEKETYKALRGADIFIANAAVSDYRPFKVFSQKIKKNRPTLTFSLQKNNDILFEVTRRKGKSLKPFVVGFSLETIQNAQKEAQRKFLEKKLDLVVLNNVSSIGSSQMEGGFVFGKKGQQFESFQRKSKVAVAQLIFDKILTLKTF